MTSHMRRTRTAAPSPAGRDERARADVREDARRARTTATGSSSAQLERALQGVGPDTPPTTRDEGDRLRAQYLSTLDTPIRDALPVARGATGATARQIQDQLVAHGADIVVDGVFGGQTEDMVRAFQHANNLSVTGVVDQMTSALLFSDQARGIDAARLDGVPGIAIGRFETWDEGHRTGDTDVVLLDGVRLAAWVAPHWAAMRDAAAADGVRLTFNSARSGFRTPADQAALYQRYGSPRAVPPGWSNHQDGHAIDLVMTPDVERWMSDHAGAFGFVRPTYEDWHWEYRR